MLPSNTKRFSSAPRSLPILLIAALAGACGEEPAGPPPAERPDVETVLEPVRDEDLPVLFEALAPPLTEALLDELKRLDPAYDGWRSEVLHDLARGALDELLEAFLRPDEADLGALLAEDFRGSTSLIPAESGPPLEVPGFVVTRAKTLDPSLHPASELPRLVSELLRPAEDATEWRSHVMITGIELEDDQHFTTDVQIHLDAPRSGRPMQINAEWSASWSVIEEGGGERALLSELELKSLDKVFAGTTLFEEHTEHAFGGLDFWEEELLKGVDDYHQRMDHLMGGSFLGMQGLAIGDVDGDGLEDIYMCQQGGLPNRLLIRTPDGRVVDRSKEAGVDFLNNTRHALLLDLDDDGDQDLVAGVGPNVLVALNDGQGAFPADEEHRVWLSIEEPGGDVYTLSAADADGDGDLDLYGCRYTGGGVMSGAPAPYHDANNGASNVYWRCEGPLEWTLATEEVGLDDDNRRFSLTSIWEDFDGDGDLDLYVTNDFGPNQLYRNESGRFHNAAPEMGAQDLASGMGATCADVDLDGDLDLYITNMFAAAGLRTASQPDRFMEGRHRELHPYYLEHSGGNSLLLNRGDGTWYEASREAGVWVGGWAWSAIFVDLNNDALDDIYVPNGFITSRRQPGDLSSYFWRRVCSQSPPDEMATEAYRDAWSAVQFMQQFQGISWSGHEENYAYLNLGGLEFTDVSAAIGADFMDDARCAVELDWDGDGRQDLLIKNRTAPRLRLLRNVCSTPGGFLSVQLEARARGWETPRLFGRDAIGALVEVEFDGRRLLRRVYSAEGYLAQASRRLHFGLGEAEEVQSLRITWPDGEVETFEDVAAGAHYRLVQGSRRLEEVELAASGCLDGLEPKTARRSETAVRRLVLTDKLPMGPLVLPSDEEPRRRVEDLRGTPLLIQLWSSSSEVCRQQLGEMWRRREELAGVGLTVVPMTVDESGGEIARARQLARDLDFASTAGALDGPCRETLQVLLMGVLRRHGQIPLPTGLLLDAESQLVAIYLGPPSLDRILADVEAVGLMNPKWATCARLSDGRWLVRGQRDLLEMAAVFEQMGRVELAELYRSVDADRKRRSAPQEPR